MMPRSSDEEAPQKYSLFAHTADLGAVIYGRSQKELFVHAAFAVYDLITDLSLVEGRREKLIEAGGTDCEDLLINYLREVLFLYQGDRFLACDYRVLSLNENSVTARFIGETCQADRHRIRREIKAVTYHHLSVVQAPGGWEATVVFDV